MKWDENWITRDTKLLFSRLADMDEWKWEIQRHEMKVKGHIEL